MSFEKVPNSFGNFLDKKITVEDHRVFRFRSFVLDVVERQLCRGDEVVPLSPKVFDALVYLAARAGHLVTKEELMNAVWPDSFVDEGNIPRTIHTLRKTLGEEEGNKFIETVPTKGYRFVADVEGLPASSLARYTEVHDGAETVPAISELSESPVPMRKGLRSTSIRLPSRLAVILAAVAIILSFLTIALTTETSSNKGPGNGLSIRTKSGKAYQYYQQGKLLVERHLDGDMDAALENFDKAIELDPNYAEAYVGRADARLWRFWATTSHDDIGPARVAIKKAIELDETSSYAHALLCRIEATYDWDFSAAEKECRRAVELDPKDAEARRELGFLLNSVGRQDEALAEMDIATAIAPTSFNKRSRGVILYFSRRYDEAIDQFKQIEETDPEFRRDWIYLVDSYEMQKDWQNAFDTYMKFREGEVSPEALDAIRTGFKAEGWAAVLKSNNYRPTKNQLQCAGSLAQLGEFDKAFELLEDMASKRRVMILHIGSDPRLDPLRSDDRFGKLLARIGLKLQESSSL